jgi:small-conductance mechanosensitive channel
MSDFLSYLFTGLPADASEQSKRARLFITYACITVMVMVMVLATVPSWPLAVGVAAGCGALGYVARLVLGGAAGNGP